MEKRLLTQLFHCLFFKKIIGGFIDFDPFNNSMDDRRATFMEKSVALYYLYRLISSWQRHLTYTNMLFTLLTLRPIHKI